MPEVHGERHAAGQAKGRLDVSQFDIRQLAVVSCFEPLEIWIYEDFYVRLCADDYDGEAGQHNRLFMSLANNSISKGSSSAKLHHDNMMFMEELDSLLKVPCH